MMFGFVSRRRHEHEIAALKADTERLRSERDQFAKDRDAFKAAAEAASQKYTDTAIVNELLTNDLVKARARLTEALPEASPDEIAAWESRVKAHDTWVPPVGRDAWEARPVDGAPARPLHPATDLVRALDRCARLETRLARAEGRRGVLGS